MTPYKVVKTKQFNSLTESRKGIMVHFDDSASDEAAWQWFEHPDCKVSYNYLVLDDGRFVVVAPEDKRAWHAGVCRPSGKLKFTDANSAFYGIAAATNTEVKATQKQKEKIADLCVMLFKKHGWGVEDLYRIVGHDTEAWKRGRKVDPTGFDKKNPILSVAEIREMVRLRLSDPEGFSYAA